VAMAVLVVILVVYKLKDQQARAVTRARPDVLVGVVTPQRRDLEIKLTFTADVLPAKQAAIFSKVSGYIRRIHADRGDFVKTGQLLVEIDDQELQASLEQARATLLSGQAGLEMAKSSLEGQRAAATYPGLFAKLPTTIIGPEEAIVFPPDAKNVHFEGEMVVVIGKRAHDVPEADAKQYVFGVTAGNDVSERDWQKADLQWFRAKGTDTFGPLGPVITTGLNYDDLLVQTRLNGEVKQRQRTTDLIFSVAAIVSYVSRYVTLMPGDVIYTGTPGTTSAMKPGDVVEVEVEGVGVLRNRVTAAAR